MAIKQIKATALAAAGLTLSLSCGAVTITLEQLTTGVSAPIGIDYHEPTNTMLGSINYPNGNPSNFVTIDGSGATSPFSSISGLTNEIKVATARSGSAQFAAGTAFSGTGTGGEVLQISADGTTTTTHTGFGGGLMRGSLYVDRTGVFNGDLIVATTSGEVWRMDGAGNKTLIASTGVHLEGLITVPNDVATYGPLAGKIIAGAEGTGDMYIVDSSGTVTTESLTWSNGAVIRIEDIDLITGNENFFGMAFAQNSIYGSSAADFAGIVGDILLTQEFFGGTGGSTGLARLFWNGTSLETEAIDVVYSAGSSNVTQWEHVSFGAAGITTIAPVPAPMTLVLMAAGLMLLRLARRA